MGYAETISTDTTVEQTTFCSPSEPSFQFGLLAHPVRFLEPPQFHKPFVRQIDDLQHIFGDAAGVIVLLLYSDEARCFARSSID